jgi:hypothetical protein
VALDAFEDSVNRRYRVQIYDFVTAYELASKTQADQAKLLCYYNYKEEGTTAFTMPTISDLMSSAGYNRPNTSRLKESLIKGKGKVFILSKTNKGSLEFIPAKLQEMDSTIGQAWLDTTTIVSDSELIDETKFCGKRNYLTRLIQQINSSYKNNCYDACAVLMRRLFEVSLILAYQNLKIEDSIKLPDGRYFMLEGIVNNAKGNGTLNLPSRIRNDLDTFREVGNLSAHNITYTAGQKDIDDIRIRYRVMLEELYNKAGLI